jgi:hypothetical protein
MTAMFIELGLSALFLLLLASAALNRDAQARPVPVRIADRHPDGATHTTPWRMEARVRRAARF